MERNGFNPDNFEAPSEKTDDSKEKKSKKKRSYEVAVMPVPEAKKEEVADHGKSLWEKLVEGDKAKTKDDNLTETEAAEDAEKVSDTKKEVLSESSTEEHEELTSDIERLSPEEEVEITSQLAAAKAAELRAEASVDGSPEDVAARQAAIEMLENLQQGEEEILTDSEELSNEADQEVVDLNNTENDAVINNTAESFDDDEPQEFDDITAVSVNGASGGSTRGRTSSPPPPTPPVLPAGPGRSGSGNLPPIAPVLPTQPGSMPPSARLANQQPSVSRVEHAPDYRNNPNASYLLVGGIVGYLIGRRRGRIKTERRMKVVQQKLEKQVAAKQVEINQKTVEVRRYARDEYLRQGLEKRRKVGMAPAETLSGRGSTNVQRSSTAVERVSEAKRVERKLSTVSAERSVGERSPASLELNDQEVLRIAETITVGATSLRKVYEARLVTRGGLHRLVNEHLEGKDIRRGLAREFLAKELSFERDPRLRDNVQAEDVSASGGGATSAAVTSTLSDSRSPAAQQPVASTSSDDSDITSAAQTEPMPIRNRANSVSTGVLTVLTLLALALAIYAVLLGVSR